MTGITKRLISSLLIVSLALSLFGCNKAEQYRKDAEAIGTAFCEKVLLGDASLLMEYIDDPEITEDTLNELMHPSDLNPEQEEYLGIIKDSTNYTIDSTIYDKELNIVFVKVSWTQRNFYSEEAQMAATAQDFALAMSEAPDMVIPVELEVDFSGEDPKIIKAMDTISSIYAYTTAENNVMPGTLADYYTDGSMVLAPKGVYTNTDSIGVRLNFDPALYSLRFIPGVTYTVSKGDDVLYPSDVISLEDNSVRLDYSSEVAGDIDLNDDGFLTEGTYTFMVFDEHYNDIARFDCEVKTEDIEKEEIVFKDLKNDYYLANLVYEFKDSDLMATSYVFMSGWWDYDGTSVGKSAFASNTKTLGFSLAVSRDNESELYYAYYFSEKSSFKGINEAEPVFESSCKPSLYDDQACYDLDFTPDELKPGYYGLVVYGDAARKHIVFQAACLVVKETSDVIG
ncbi:MAG: hypothetical protein IKZ29_11100 [Clostridiales bacterium]|nr:hypothetical protein [Clostridiales bacterium]